MSTYKDFFPELAEKEALIIDIVKDEEAAFSQMLTRGVRYFQDLVETTNSAGAPKLIDAEQGLPLCVCRSLSSSVRC